MSYDGYLSFGGTEVMNAARTQAYVDTLLPNFGLQGCAECDDLRHALGDEEYTSPFVDQPDWFDANEPDSWGFCGLYPISVEGLDDAVRESSVTQLATDGAVMSAPRQRGREILVSALLIGKDQAAVQYGITWLRYATLGTGCRDSEQCTGDHLCYFSACPPMCTDSPDVTDVNAHLLRTCEDGLITTVERSCSLPYERNLYQVTVIDGPRVVEKYDTVCGAMWRVEWTMVAGVPWSYATATYVARSLDTSPSAIVPDISCEPGSTSVRRRNLATNPVPIGGVATATTGWGSPDTGVWSAAADTEVVRLDGDRSVRMERLVDTPGQNLATNPVPSGTLDGWSWSHGDYEQVTTTLETGPGPGDVPGFVRATIDQAKTSGWSGPTYVQDVTAVTGTVTITMWVRSSVAGVVPLRVQALGPEGVVVGDVTHAPVEVEADVWTDVGPVTGDVPAGATQVRVIAQMPPAQILPAGATVDAAQVVITPGGSLTSPVIAHMVFAGQPDRDTGTIQLMPQVVYAASIYVRPSRAAHAQIIATFYDDAGDVTSTAIGPLLDAGAARWTRITAAFAAPDDVISATFEVIVTRGNDGPAAVGDTAWFTNMLVERTGASGVDAYGQFTAASFNMMYKSIGAGIVNRDWYTRGPVMAAQIIESGVAIVGAQEIKHESRDPNASQASDLVGWLNDAEGSSGQWSFALASRYVGFVFDQSRVSQTSPVTTEDIITTPALKRPGNQRVMGWARFKLLAVDEDFWMITTHFPLESEATSPSNVTPMYRQAVNIVTARALILERTAPVLIAGDFNQAITVPGMFAEHGYGTVQARAPFVSNAQFRSFNAFSTTQAGRQDGLWIDNLLTRTPTVAGAQLVMNFAPGTNTLPLVEPFASDHFMVAAQVQLVPDQRASAASAPVAMGEQLADEDEAVVRRLLRGLETQLEEVLAAVEEVPVIAAVGQGLVGSYFDGTFPDTATADYAWTGTAHQSISTMSITLPAVVGPILDPDCAVVPPAPRPPVLEIACLDTPSAWRRFTAVVPSDSVPVWRDSVPIITIRSGALEVRQVRVRFYPNPFLNAPQWLDPCDFCGEFVISYLPANSVMTIDGIRQQATVAGPQGAVQVANHLLYSSAGGPMVWPLLSCGISYTAVLDVSPQGVQDLSADLCLAARE